MSTTRLPNHVAQTFGSDVVHAAHDLTMGRAMHVLACNGRAVEAAAWNGTVDQVTCRSCSKALANGKAVWTGKVEVSA